MGSLGIWQMGAGLAERLHADDLAAIISGVVQGLQQRAFDTIGQDRDTLRGSVSPVAERRRLCSDEEQGQASPIAEKENGSSLSSEQKARVAAVIGALTPSKKPKPQLKPGKKSAQSKITKDLP